MVERNGGLLHVDCVRERFRVRQPQRIEGSANLTHVFRALEQTLAGADGQLDSIPGLDEP